MDDRRGVLDVAAPVEARPALRWERPLGREGHPGEPPRLTPLKIVDYLRSLPTLWRDSGPDGRQAITGAIFARTEVLGFQRLEYELTDDAVELGLDAALPAVLELKAKVGGFGRGERDSPSLTQRPAGFVLINRTARNVAATASSA